MEICICIEPDNQLKKKIDDFRYHYDRRLLKQSYPYICAFGPYPDYVNLKQFIPKLKSFLRGKKRFRIQTDIFAFLEREQKIFLDINQKGELREIYDFILKHFNLEEQESEYFPHILIARNHSLPELQLIFNELAGFQLQYDFMISKISILLKEDEHWEEYESLEL
jgi:2'-5' RNA ligase